MFNKQDRMSKDPAPQTATGAAAPAMDRRSAQEPVEQKLNSVFGRGSTMNGTVRADGSVRVDGEFEGTLESGDTLVVGKEGTFRGDVKVKRAVIGGRFEGNIHASVKVELHSGCEMLGEVVTPSLVIEEGVVFEGSCKMGAKTQPARDMKSGQSGQRPSGATLSPSQSSSMSSTAPASTAGVGAGAYERKN